MATGWVDQPDKRGTFDILQSCVVTTFLCSRSILFLNVPADYESRTGFILLKIRWMFFTLLFPEMVTGVAAEQWRSARQSVEDFVNLQEQWQSTLDNSVAAGDQTQLAERLLRFQESPWTMRHAFFADMGGIHLHCPPFRPFPVNAHQVHYLVMNRYLEYPDLKEKAIWDRNKADGLARIVTVAQTVWFVAESIARLIQHLNLSSFELSTNAFIFCTVNTFFFWRHKPLDVETPIVLKCQIKLEQIILNAEDKSGRRYSKTPLDFLDPLPNKTSFVTPFFFGMKIAFPSFSAKHQLPISSFGNISTIPPRGLKTADMIYAVIFTLSYSGIHLAGWHLTFPSSMEQQLWRIASLVLLGLIVMYLIAFAFGTLMAKRLARTFFNRDDVDSILGLGSLLPRWLAILLHLPVIIAYSVARVYIICEGCVGLRSLPLAAFNSVQWSNFVPHA